MSEIVVVTTGDIETIVRSMPDLDRWSIDNWNGLDPLTRAACLDRLRDAARTKPWDAEVALWKANVAAGRSPSAHDMMFHFGAGMGVRNLLRYVVKDDALPLVMQPGGQLASNWDDYYMGAVDAIAREPEEQT